MLKSVALFYVLLMFFYIKNANSVAWLRKKDEVISIHEMALQNQINSNLYSNNEIGSLNITGLDYHLYAEYGATDKLTIGVNSILEIYTINNGTKALQSGAAVKLSEYFIRYGIFHNKNRSVIITGQFLYKPPSLYDTRVNANTAIYGATNQHDVEGLTQLLINWNKNESLFGFYTGYKQMLNIEFGYRQRFNLDFNEIRLNIQYMFWFSNFHAILLGFYKTMRAYNSQTYGNPMVAFKYVSWTANDQNTIDISWVMFYEEKKAMSFGMYVDVYTLPFGYGEANLSTIGIKCGFWFL